MTKFMNNLQKGTSKKIGNLYNHSLFWAMRNIDDKQPKSKILLDIPQDTGIYSEKIIKLLNPSTPDPICKNVQAKVPTNQLLV